MEAIYKVESVQERPTIDAAGQLANMVIITIKTFQGSRGSVEIPLDQYMALTATDEGKMALRERVTEKAAALDAPLEF